MLLLHTFCVLTLFLPKGIRSQVIHFKYLHISILNISILEVLQFENSPQRSKVSMQNKFPAWEANENFVKINHSKCALCLNAFLLTEHA